MSCIQWIYFIHNNSIYNTVLLDGGFAFDLEINIYILTEKAFHFHIYYLLYFAFMFV